jgi:hypothetical protein
MKWFKRWRARHFIFEAECALRENPSELNQARVRRAYLHLYEIEVQHGRKSA